MNKKQVIEYKDFGFIDVKLDEIFRDCVRINYPYKKYKKEIYERAKSLLDEMYKKDIPIRLVGVRVDNLGEKDN